MDSFDTNLIRYKKLFDVPMILAIYQDCQKFNYLMPKGYHQFKLFQMQFNFFGMLLGISKRQKYYHYNLLGMHYPHPFDSEVDRSEIYEINSEIDPLTKKLKKMNLLYFTPISSLKDECLKAYDLTEKKFLNDFSPTVFSPMIDLI